MSKWLPIASAPKGEGDLPGPWVVLGHRGYHGYSLGRFYPKPNVWRDVEGDPIEHAEFWMEIPPLPEGDEE